MDGTRCVVQFRCGNHLGEKGCVVFLMACLQLQVPCWGLFFPPHVCFRRGILWGTGGSEPSKRQHWLRHKKTTAQHRLLGSNVLLNKHSLQVLPQLTDYGQKNPRTIGSNLNLFHVYFGIQNRSLCNLYQSISGPCIQLAVTACGFSLRGNHKLTQTPSASMEFLQMMGSHLLSEREEDIFTMSEVW